MRSAAASLSAAALLLLSTTATATTTTTTTTTTSSSPTAHDSSNNITYRGLSRNNLDLFLGIPYAHDTSGTNRFKPPVPLSSLSGSIVDATAYGPACPQSIAEASFPFALTPVDVVSEDCLHLNIARPKKKANKKNKREDGEEEEEEEEEELLPVMVYIHGGSFWYGQSSELVISPDGLVLESVENGTPVIHVAMNYRLGVFGFAQSDALRDEGSLNAGLLDQRLALEWVRDNIATFGGDPSRVTIFGQSSGGLAVGLHIMAYGAEKPAPFQQAICQSQALEPGITGTFTIDAMQAVADATGCNSTALHSSETVECLRGLSTEALYNASLETYTTDLNIGDIWLPVVDDAFLPAAPSELIARGRFHNITTMMVWCQDDVTYFTVPGITTAEHTREFIEAYVPDLSAAHVDELLALYPSDDDYTPSGEGASAEFSAEFYRSARIFRDIIMTCPPLLYGEKLAERGNDVYLVDWNQTILDAGLAAAPFDAPGRGVIHTSEFAYVFGNLTHYNVGGVPFEPTATDWELEKRGSRSWVTFATTGKPGGLAGTFQGVDVAFGEGDGVRVFVVGGDDEGLSAIDGQDVANESLKGQKLRERCAFINSPEIIQELKF